MNLKTVAFALGSMLLSSLNLSAQAYSHDSYAYMSVPRWMAGVDASRRLSQLSLPGTHESLSMYGGDLVQTQSMSLFNQLESGIRVLDIRCVPQGHALQIYHGVIPQLESFDEVMGTVTSFLAQNPSETVLMRIKNEQDSDHTTFENAFKGYWQRYPNVFWNPATSENSVNPKLSEMRGKLVVLQNFSAPSGATYGIGYLLFNAQDDYTLNHESDLYTKWTEVKMQLALAYGVGANPNSTVLCINYLSGAMGAFGASDLIFPYFVASGKSSPQTNAPALWTGILTTSSDKDPDFPHSCWGDLCSINYDGTNDLTVTYLATLNATIPIGIIMADFPGQDLISSVINRNIL